VISAPVSAPEGARGGSIVSRCGAGLDRRIRSWYSWLRTHPVVPLLVLVLIPVAVLAGRAMFQTWVPLGDQATIALRTLEVGTSHTPLVGPYSRFGWSHPGPALFYELALFYRVTGDRISGLLLGTVVINATALVLITWVLLRRGGITLAALGIAFFGFAAWSVGASFLWYPWNPTAALLPFAAALVLTWSVSNGSRRAIPVLAGVSSFLVQTHVEYAPIVVGFAGCAAVGYWQSRRERDSDPSPSRRDLSWRAVGLATAAVLLVIWIPPIVDAALHRGGNFRALIRFGFSSHSTLGFASALRVMGLALSVHAPWLGFHEPLSTLFQGGVAPQGTPIPVGAAVLVVAIAVAARRRDLPALRLCLVVLVSLGLATISVANIVGTPYPYLVYYLRILAAATWLASVWTFLRAVQARLPRAEEGRRVWAALSLTAAAAVTAILTASAVAAGIGPTADHASSQALTRLMPAILRRVGHDGTVLVEASSSFGGTGFRSGLMLQLEQHGVAARAEHSTAFMYGAHYTDVGRSQARLLLAVGGDEIARARANGDRLVGQYRQPPPYPALAPPLQLAVFQLDS